MAMNLREKKKRIEIRAFFKKHDIEFYIYINLIKVCFGKNVAFVDVRGKAPSARTHKFEQVAKDFAVSIDEIIITAEKHLNFDEMQL